MRSDINPYSAGFAIVKQPTSICSRAGSVIFTLPSYVWLSMILLAASLLAISTVIRSRTELQTARSFYQVTGARLSQSQEANGQLKVNIEQVQNGKKMAIQVPQTQLHYTKPSEIVIATNQD